MNLKATAVVIEQLRSEVRSNKEAMRRERVLNEENNECLMGTLTEDQAMDPTELELHDFATFKPVEPEEFAKVSSSVPTRNPLIDTL